METSSQLLKGTTLECNNDLFFKNRIKPTVKVSKGETVLINRIVEYRMGGFTYHCVITGTDIFRTPRTANISVEEMKNLTKLN